MRKFPQRPRRGMVIVVMLGLGLVVCGLLGVTLAALRWTEVSVQHKDGYVDAVSYTAKHASALPMAWGNYISTAWLDNDIVVFAYAPRSSFKLTEYRLVAHRLLTRQTTDLPRPSAEGCVTTWLQGGLSRLPNGKLGFLWLCNTHNGSYFTAYDRLYVWDKEADSLDLLYAYPAQFTASTYSFAPDMSEFIQESPVGGPLNNELYRMTLEGKQERLFPTYQRVGRPAWSTDGQLIAFAGTETYPGGPSSEFKRFDQIADLARYPWDLFLMEADGSQVRRLFAAVGYGVTPRWVPGMHRLSFIGTYQNVDGLWVFDVDTGQMTRIWPYSVPFDWSPDGRRLTIIRHGLFGSSAYHWMSGFEFNQPVIVDLSGLSW